MTRESSARGAFVAFRDPSFKWHWFSTLASFSAMQMQGIALGILGWEMSHSYTVVGILQAAFALPMAVLSLPGGALVDRVEKRRVIVASQLILALLGTVIAALVQADRITLVLLFGSGLVQGAMFSVNGPARMALLTEMVAPAELSAAISMQNIAMNSTRVIAPAIAGLFIAFVSIEGAYYLAGLLYVVCVMLILQIPRSPGHAGRSRSPLLSDIRAGLGYVAGDRMLRSLMLSGLTIALFIMPYQVMLPGFAGSLGHSELLGAMVAISGVGGLIGAFAVASIGDHPRKPYVQFLFGLTSGASLIALGLLATRFGLPGAFASLGVVGAASMSYMTLNQTMLMTGAAPEFRGRVSSISMLTFSAMPLMALPLGVFADLVGGGWAFVAQGAIVLSVILLLAFTNRAHTFARRAATPLPAPPEADAATARPSGV